MISERQFSHKYSSVWNDLLPMSDKFMRVLNLKSDRYLEPFEPLAPAAYNAYVNEAAFRVAAHPEKLLEMSDKLFSEICRETLKYIETIGNQKIRFDDDLIPAIETDISDISMRIERFIPYQIGYAKDVVYSPSFPGCGIIQSCCGDMYANGVLYEIKAGGREFRAVDLRQLLTYAALNSQSGSMHIEKVGLVNPRTGKYWISRLSDVAISISGLTEGELFNSIVDIISVDRLSN